MRLKSSLTATFAGFVWAWSVLLAPAGVYAQNAQPTPDQLDQLLAPIALYPDPLVAQICAASTDPQQILDADAWLHQNPTLTGQARTDAAQAQGFDPAFIALVNFPQVLDMMAQNIDSYAAIGQAFAANQGTVMESVQRLRQQAYAVGALQTNQYQTVDVQGQGTSQVVVIQPANPQVIYVPQYNPQVVYVQPDTSAMVAASLITFGAGIALGAWIADSSRPWGWGGWGWNWGGRTVIVHNNVWVVNNRYRPRYPSYHYRPPVYNRPVYARPPNNWHDRPYYRPPGGRPPQYQPPGGRPPQYQPPGGRPPEYRPPGTTPPAYRPPGNQPPGSRPPGNQPPGSRPPGNTPAPGSRPPGASQPGQRPPAMTRPTPGVGGGPQSRPSPYAGYPRGPGAGNSLGGRPSAFGGDNNAAAARAASNRGRSSAPEQRQAAGGRHR